MKRFLSIFITMFVCMFLDTFLFGSYNLYGIRPDAVMAAVAAIGVLFGSLPAMLCGGIIGLITDVVFSKAVGLSAALYLIMGATTGRFFKKFYADNPVIPAIAAAFGSFLKEHVFALFTFLTGGRFSYLDMLAGYILPGALMTSGVCILIYFILKRVTRERLYALERNIGGSK